MNNSACPLCKGDDVALVETIKAKDINDLYNQIYQIEVLYLFPDAEVHFFRCKRCYLKFFQPTALGDEQFYKALQKTDLYYMEDKEEYQFASKYILPSHDILDVGCGKGAFSKKVKCKSFTGLELSVSAKELAEEEGTNIINQTVQEHSKENKGKYDVVCTFQVVEHVETEILREFLSTMIDCLKTDGLLIISVPSDDSFVSNVINGALNMPPHHQTRWPDKALKEIATLFNLQLVNLHHDTLSPRNVEEYVYLSIVNRFSKKHSLITKEATLLQKITFHLLKFVPKKLKIYMVNKIKPNGHSITCVYKKK